MSPPSKNNGAIARAAVSSDGQRIGAPIQIGPSSGGASLFLATRAPSGWTQASMMPPADDLLYTGLYSLVAWTPNLSTFFALAHAGLVGGVPVAMVALDGSGGQSVLQSFAPGEERILFSGGAVVSDDGSHVYANTLKPIDPGHVPGTSNLYDLGSDPPALISRMPDGSVPACGAIGQSGSPGFADSGLNSTTVQRWVSSDGQRIFFLTPGDVCDGSAPVELYVRDRTVGATSLVSGPAVSGPDLRATFLQASGDGSQVVYATAARLVAGDTNAHLDVYRYTLGAGGGNECLTCLVPDANVTQFSPGTGQGIAVSGDLSHVYFVSKNQLVAGKGTAGVNNLYVWHKDPNTGLAGIDYISPGPATPVMNNPTLGSSLTPDGKVLLYTASNAGMNALTPGQSNGGLRQDYRYDDSVADPAARLTCVSCPQGHAPSVAAVTASISQNAPIVSVRTMSDDGSVVFFSTAEPLVAGDVNASVDIYEWHDGLVGLISDGVTPHGLFDTDQLTGTSASGNDVFFTSYSHLTPDVEDNSTQLYDARVGAAVPVAPGSPTGCSGEGCQGLPSGAPTFGDPGSSSFVGPGNVPSTTGSSVRARFGVGRVSARQRMLFARTGRLTVSVGVTGAGTVSAVARARVRRHMHTVASALRIAHKPGVLKLGLRLSAAARRQLATTHILRVSVAVGFSKTSGVETLSLVLRVPAQVGGR